MTGLELDWTQVAAFLSAAALIFAGFGWIVREIIRREVKPMLEKLGSDMNGKMDVRIDGRIDAKLIPVVEQLEHINEELSQNLDGYRKAS